MIGLVIVTHGALADEFRAALEHVVGPQEQLATVAIGPEDALDARRQEILDKAHAVETGDGVVILTDMFGGTPSNLALSVLDETDTEVVAGVNLPLLVKLAGERQTQNLTTAVERATTAGRKYITVASDVLDGTA